MFLVLVGTNDRNFVTIPIKKIFGGSIVSMGLKGLKALTYLTIAFQVLPWRKLYFLNPHVCVQWCCLIPVNRILYRPFRLLSRADKVFTIYLNDRKFTISVDRLKMTSNSKLLLFLLQTTHSIPNTARTPNFTSYGYHWHQSGTEQSFWIRIPIFCYITFVRD